MADTQGLQVISIVILLFPVPFTVYTLVDLYFPYSISFLVTVHLVVSLSVPEQPAHGTPLKC